ncbi:MAG: DUF4276 family protein [Gemmatimonadaceae bacterium]
MKILLFVEGATEARCIPPLLRRWLDAHSASRVGVIPVKFEGWATYYKDIAHKVSLNLGPNRRSDIVGGIGLLDLYGPTFFPEGMTSAEARRQWAISHIETRVGNPLFQQHFAVHETEAWLLSQPEIFPRTVSEALGVRSGKPESINFANPPAKLLARIYRERLNKNYKKIIDGFTLFGKLDLDEARKQCPSLVAFLDDALRMATQS